MIKIIRSILFSPLLLTLPFPGFRSYCRGYPYAGPHAVPADYWGIRTVVQARTTSTGRDLPPVILTTGKREWTFGPFSFQRLTVDEDCVSLFGSSHSLFSRAAIFSPQFWFLLPNLARDFSPDFCYLPVFPDFGNPWSWPIPNGSFCLC